ncbi:MAG: hypothetical protein C0498_07795 [Anaerolinea sp.]|nr:hypothetical protein [Anaerolinea sp.]
MRFDEGREDRLGVQMDLTRQGVTGGHHDKMGGPGRPELRPHGLTLIDVGHLSDERHFVGVHPDAGRGHLRRVAVAPQDGDVAERDEPIVVVHEVGQPIVVADVDGSREPEVLTNELDREPFRWRRWYRHRDRPETEGFKMRRRISIDDVVVAVGARLIDHGAAPSLSCVADVGNVVLKA